MRKGQIGRESIVERFWRLVEKTEQCWLWVGTKNKDGYGMFSCGRRHDRKARMMSAHRWSYENAYNDLPKELDHVCRTRSCVRPSHLRPITHAENCRISIMPNSLKTHCPAGHLYDGRNKNNARICTVCNRAASQRYLERQRS